jgi:hypothetical protein
MKLKKSGVLRCGCHARSYLTLDLLLKKFFYVSSLTKVTLYFYCYILFCFEKEFPNVVQEGCAESLLSGIRAKNIARSDAGHRNQKITMRFLTRKRYPPRVVQSCSHNFSSLVVDDPHAATDVFPPHQHFAYRHHHCTTTLCVACF